MFCSSFASSMHALHCLFLDMKDRTACTIDAAGLAALLRKHVQTLEDILLGDCFIICVSLNRHVKSYEKTLLSSISIVGESYIYLSPKSPLLENFIYMSFSFLGVVGTG